ncbi:MAG: class I SAM-dependent rRNA methyltransferase, partial [Anaerolineales bacterium]|nr:class I SAM-dependent rRNA methyltransferase [Anaerolineales bacterium]
MTGIAKVILKAGKEKSVLRFHPWIFSSAIQRIDGEVGAGDSVEVFSHKGDWLAWGVFSPQSQIRVRLWSWDQDKPIDNELIRNRLRSAISLRKSYRFFTETNCVRLVYAESDGIPGLIVDQYDQYLVLQSLSWGVERRKEPIVREIVSLTGIPNVFERSDGEARKLEGLRDCKGTLFGAEPPETIRVIENGILFYVDIRRGHKTGFYLDQKVNRLRVMYYVKDKEVLDCFCFSGGMTIPSIVGGAKKLTCIDESAEALDLLTRNLELNQIPREKISINCGDVFQKLREF